MEEFDVVVVGTSAAGSATAILLAHAGYRVLILGREEALHTRLGGACLSPGAVRILQILGVLPLIEAERPAHLMGWRLISPTGWELYSSLPASAITTPYPGTTISLARSRLDQILLDAARRQNAEVRTDMRITEILRDDHGAIIGLQTRDAGDRPRTIRSRLLVSTDGHRSIVARRLGLIRRLPRQHKISLTSHLYGVEGLDSTGEMHLTRNALAGVAPVHSPRPGEGPALVSLIMDLYGNQYARKLTRIGTAPFFTEMLNLFPHLRDRLPSEATHPDTAVVLANTPSNGSIRPTISPGAVLVDDEPDYYTQFTGQGVYKGLATAMILAEEADTALRAGRREALLLRRYARRRGRVLYRHRIAQHMIGGVISRPGVYDWAITFMDRYPHAAAMIVDQTIRLLTRIPRPMAYSKLARVHSLPVARIMHHVATGPGNI